MKTSRSQFGFGAMLFATLCVAGFFAGYHYGGATKDMQIADSTVFVVSYDVSEFIDQNSVHPVDAQLSQICTLLTETVEPDSWLGGDRDVVPYPTNSSVVVRQSGSCHAAIATLLEQLRTLKKRTQPGEELGVTDDAVK